MTRFYRLVRLVIDLLVLRGRRDRSKDVEILVLRDQLAVLGRQISRAVRFLIRDGAGQFVGGFDEVFRSDGTRIIRTPPHTPVANAFAERWVGTVRRELLDRTLIWNRRQLEQLLRGYLQHYNTHRPHRSLDQRAPDNAEVLAYRPGQPLRRHPTCGRLINEYRQAA